MGMYLLLFILNNFYFRYFSIFESFKTRLGKIDKIPKDLIIPISGASARICIVTCSLPIEFLRTNLQANPSIKWHQVIRNTVNVSIFKLWTGLFPTLLRDVPFSSFYWYSYDYHRRFLIKYLEPYIPNIRTRRVTAEFTSGICSGSIAAFLTTPFDVIKTQLQSNIQNKESSLQAAKRIYSLEGYRGFFAGVQARVLKVGPACGVGITCYEIFKRYYSKQYLAPNNL